MIDPALRQQIIALAAAGNPPRHIAAMIKHKLPLDRIGDVVLRARKNGIDIPHFRSPNGSRQRRSVEFPAETLELLIPHAQRRNITPNELMRRIIDTLIDSDLIDAVLDDRGGP